MPPTGTGAVLVCLFLSNIVLLSGCSARGTKLLQTTCEWQCRSVAFLTCGRARRCFFSAPRLFVMSDVHFLPGIRQRFLPAGREYWRHELPSQRNLFSSSAAIALLSDLVLFSAPAGSSLCSRSLLDSVRSWPQSRADWQILVSSPCRQWLTRLRSVPSCPLS